MEPVKLDTTEVQVLPEGQFRVASGTHPGYCVLQLLIKGKWCPLYEWRDEKAALVDQECYNWYSCTYPKARFTTSFFMCRIIGNERHELSSSKNIVRTVIILSGKNQTVAFNAASTTWGFGASPRNVLKVCLWTKAPGLDR